MNKDDILARSRAENQGTDEYERVVLEKAGKLAAQVGLLACCVIAIITVMVTERPSITCWVIYFSILAAQFWMKWRYLKRRHELALAMFYTAVGLMFLGLFALEMVRWNHG
ncbi:MAG: hypothetical protein HDT14_12475 [Oscillibacter sp.]|nr:hypothetical protein [Oscillibacter sp.]